MTRFLSREEWPLVLAGVAAGVLTSLLAIYMFVTSLGGTGGIPAEPAAGDTVAATAAEQTGGRPRTAGGAPLVGAHEANIFERLAAAPVSAAPLRGPVTITARDILWRERSGARFVRAQRVTAQLQPAAAGRGDIILDNVVVTSPVVALREDRSGWNWEVVLAELLEGEPRPGRKRTVQLRNVRIDNGDVEVVRLAQRFAFRSLEATLPLVVFSEEGVAEPFLLASSATARFVQQEPAADLTVALTDGRFTFPEGFVRFDVAAARLDETRFADLEGVWNPLEPGYGVTATGRALAVDFEDVDFMLPETFPKTGTASFAWSVKPAAPDGTEVTLTELDARSGDSHVTGSLTAFMGVERFRLIAADLGLEPLQLALVQGFVPDTLPYGGFVEGRVTGTGGNIDFDVTATLTSAYVATPFTTDLQGSVLLTDTGFTLRSVIADFERLPLAALRDVAPGLALEGLITGRVALTGSPDRTPLDVAVRIELGLGVATVNGTVDLTGTVPSYDVTGQLLGVDLQSILQPDVPPVAVNATFALAGTGVDPETMDATVALNGRFTGWQATSGDTLHLAASVGSGELHVDTLIATLATARVAAAGDWRFIEPQNGAVTYSAEVSSLAPFGPWLPVVGDSAAAGSLQAAGSIAGTLDRMRLQGDAAITELRAGEWQAQSVTAEYDLTLGGAVPRGVVSAHALGVGTATAGNYREATLELSIASPALAFQLDAEREDGGLVQVVASGTVPETGPREVVIEEAFFDLEQDRWSLVQPARVSWTGGGPYYVDNLDIRARDSEGRILVDGRVLPLAELDAHVSIAQLPVDDVLALFGQPPRVAGMLWGEGTVRGGDDPAVDMNFRIENGAVAGVELRLLDGLLAYDDGQMRVEGELVIDSTGVMELDATIPALLTLRDSVGFALRDGVPMSGSIVADNMALAPFGELVPRVRDLTGVVNANVALGGTPDAPEVNGSFTLESGSVFIPELSQEYTEISADIGFDGQRLEIRDMRARSDGWLSVDGHVLLEELDEPPVLDVVVTLDAFRPIGVDNAEDAAVNGTVNIDGPLAALVVTGSVEVRDGYIVIPQFGATAAAAALADMTRPAPVFGQPLDIEATENWLENLSVRNLNVTAGEGAWFSAAEARVQLTGDLVVNKSGDDISVTGTLQGNRGQYTLVAGPLVRRFDIVAAQVRFLGTSPPNPAIDITARRIVLDPGGRDLDVDVRITGTLESPSLSLAGGEGGPAVAESELLSFLLFGQPGFALGGGTLPGEEILEETFFGGALEIAALELERSLGGLGLDIFQIRLGTGSFGGLGSSTFVFGRQLADDVFLTVETGIGALFGSGQSDLTTWAIRLDWALDRRTRVRFAWEPVHRGRVLRSSGLALPTSQSLQQYLLEIRRRWTY